MATLSISVPYSTERTDRFGDNPWKFLQQPRLVPSAVSDTRVPELNIAHLQFADACCEWLKWRETNRSAGTVANYKSHLVGLNVFFNALTLETIMAGHLRMYQEQRLKNEGGQWCRPNCPTRAGNGACGCEPAGPSYINHELNTLAQMLDMAGQWERLRRYYQPLMLPKARPQRVLTPQEKEDLFKAAERDPECLLAYIVAGISSNTTATGAELRSVQLRHLDVTSNEPCIEIPPEMVKNEYRARRIPLNSEALKYCRMALERANFLGSVQSTDYLFPFRVKLRLYDPSRPASASWLKKCWPKLRKAAGIPWVRPHDMRHQAVTELLELGADEATVKAIAGHVSQNILRRYSHHRYGAQRKAIDLLTQPVRRHVPRAETFRDRIARSVAR